MNVELRQLRCLVAIVDAGSFTDAGIDLGVSQAAVSRTLASLETALGVRLLRRTTRDVTLTAAGSRVLPHARRTLAEAEDVVRAAAAGQARLRIGYAWSAMGRHTTPFQRRWAAEHPEVELQLVRTNSATAGLAEGSCDIAVVRTEPDQRHDRRPGTPLLRHGRRRRLGRAPVPAPGRDQRAHAGHRPAHRNDHAGPVAARGGPGHRVHRRHRRLAG